MIKFLVGLAVGALAVLSYMVVAQDDAAAPEYYVDQNYSQNGIFGAGLVGFTNKTARATSGTDQTGEDGIRLYKAEPFLTLSRGQVETICIKFDELYGRNTSKQEITASFHVTLTPEASLTIKQKFSDSLNGQDWAGPFSASVSLAQFGLAEVSKISLEEEFKLSERYSPILLIRPYLYTAAKRKLSEVYGVPEPCYPEDARLQAVYESIVAEQVDPTSLVLEMLE